MTWAYDSKLPAPLRTTVRNAVIALLSPLQTPLGFFEAIIPIGFLIEGPNDDLGIDLLMTELRGKTSAVAIACGELASSPAGAPTRSRGDLDVDVYVLSMHRRGLTAGRTSGDAIAAASDSADPGLDAALELVWQFLFDADLGAGKHIQTLIHKRERQLIANNDMTIWHQQWGVIVTRDVNLKRAITQKLQDAKTTLHLQTTAFEPSAFEPTAFSDAVGSPNIVEITRPG